MARTSQTGGARRERRGVSRADRSPRRSTSSDHLNGEEHRAEVEPRLLLVHFIRETLGLTGTHIGCDTTSCGACTVLLDGRPIKSCTMFAVQADGRQIRTVEGLEQGGQLHPIQEGFWEEHGLQCGFCTPGMMMTSVALLERNPDPERARDPPGDLRQPLPLHRLRQHRQVGPVRRRGSCAAAGEPTADAAPAARIEGGSSMTTATRPIGASGHSVQRKEDPRFIRGKGTYVDDVTLPGMLYLDIVRSPYAHARITNIDTSAALAMPGVLAVITGKDLDAAGPRLDADADVATSRWCCRPTAWSTRPRRSRPSSPTSRYIAADGVQAVDVDYEPLPPVVDPTKRHRPERAARAARTASSRPTTSGTGRPATAATDRVFDAGRGRRRAGHLHPAHPRRLDRDLRLRRQLRPGSGKLTIWMTTQAPHAIRTVFSLVSRHPGAQDPDHLARHRRRLRRQGAGLPRLRARRRRGADHRQPVKWIEDRSENLQADSFARDYHITPSWPPTADGKITALRVKTLADHGAFDAAANPSKFPAGLFSICTGSYDLQAAHVEVDGVYTNKPPGGIAYRCSFRVTEAVHMIERMVDVLADELKMDPAELRFKNFIQPEAVPVQVADRLGVRQRQLPGRAREGARQDRLPGLADASKPRSGRAAS